MIIVYAGRRPSDPDGVFPAAREPYLVERVERLLAALRPTRVVGSGAAGSDVIILEAACRLGIPATVVLGGGVEAFAADSVDDKPGWRGRFDAVIGAPGVSVEPLALSESGGDAYRAVTRHFIARAEELRDEAAATEDNEVLVGLLLSGGSRGDDDYTEDLGLQVEAAGNLVLRLDPRVGRDASPTAFVAMPFGERKDPTRGLRRYNSDATWNRLLLPALLDSGYRAVRTDTEASRQLIDSRMILDLIGADVVVADMATLNPNVFWELGVRHTARRQGTLVIAPARLSPPFDIRSVPVHPYGRDPGGITDRQAVEGLRGLRDAIRAAGAPQRHPQVPDSPVHAAVPELQMSGVPAGASHGTDWMERITVAAELRDPEELLAVVAGLEDEDLAPRSRRALRVQAGLALVRLQRHSDAIDVLRPAVDEDPSYDEELLQQQFAHALVRARGSDDDREARLLLAEHRLRVLDERHPDSGETLGLLGSAAKERARLRRKEGQEAEGELRLAADSYLRGFVADPLDHYPGVNAVALLRLLGSLGAGPQREQDLAEARKLLPIVRFAVLRLGASADDVWAQATLGELALQAFYLSGEGGEDELQSAQRHYALAAARATPQQLGSMAAQLEMMLVWGDPADVVQPLLDLVRDRM